MTPTDAVLPIAQSSLTGAASVFPIPEAGKAGALNASAGASAPANPLGSFGQLFSEGLADVNEKVANADRLVRSFALDESSVPIHQVTIALEEARLAVELAMQVRTRLVEAYKELMNTQL